MGIEQDNPTCCRPGSRGENKERDQGTGSGIFQRQRAPLCRYASSGDDWLWEVAHWKQQFRILAVSMTFEKAERILQQATVPHPNLGGTSHVRSRVAS